MLAMRVQRIIFKVNMITKLPSVSKSLIGCLVFMGFTVGSYAQEVLLPPFGLQWGGEAETLKKWASDQQLKITERALSDKPRHTIIRVKSASGPLPDHKADALEARYHAGKLYEVSVHYGATTGDPKSIVNEFNNLKSLLAVKHGMFSPNNKQQKKVEGGISKSVSYHVEPVSGVVLLMVLSEFEDRVREAHYARFSLIYRNQNIIQMK
jgi:hypothetical protein